MDIARSIRVIQIDSIAVAGAPTQYLVPFSRLGPYDRAILDRLVFVDRRLFHYIAHAASLVLTEDFPIFASTLDPARSRALVEEYSALVRSVVSEMAPQAEAVVET